MRLYWDSGVFAVAETLEDPAELGEGRFLSENVRLADVQYFGDGIKEVVIQLGTLLETTGRKGRYCSFLGEVLRVADEFVDRIYYPFKKHAQRGEYPWMVYEVHFQPMSFYKFAESIEVIDEYHLIEKLQLTAEGQLSP